MSSEKIIICIWLVLYNPTLLVCIPTIPIFITYTFRNNKMECIMEYIYY